MKSTTFAVSAVLAAIAIAQPHAHQHQHQHQKMHEKREIVWTTEIDIVTETVPITTTIWVNADEVPATTSISTSTTTTSSATKEAQFYQTTAQTSAPAPTTLSTSTSSTPLPTPYVASVAPAVVESPSTTPAPIVVASTTSAVVVASSSSTIVAPSSSAAVNSPATNTESSGYTGVCAADSPCTGDITFYTAGLGACGETTDGDTTRVVALPYALMGTESNDNPYCGMTITITKGGKSTTATVVDKCMGCLGDSIDLSTLAFSDLADFSVGRTTAEWYFN